MNMICKIYRKACRELSPADCALLNKLLREMATNTIRSQLAWNVKTDFLTLWFISAGRFPEIATAVTNWCIQQLPFILNEEEHQLLML